VAPKAKKVKIEEDWRRELVIQWTGMVIRIARRYYKDIPDDVIQEGYLGLCIAAARYEPQHNVMFQTYAQHWVKALILEHMIRNHGPVRFGTTKQERNVFFNLGKNRRSLEDTSEVLAARMRVDEQVMERMRARLAQRDLSFDAPAEVTAKPLEIASDDVSAETELGDAEVNAAKEERVRAAVKRLDERERFIIEGRFLRGEPQTLQVLGDKLGISRERVRQLEERAKKRLARMLMGKEKEVA
jgi:RNA polymerase sigma-32 factor